MEQHKQHRKCICLISKSHSLADCNVKKEYDKLLLAKKNSVSQPSLPIDSTGQQHHVTEGFFDDAVWAVTLMEMLCSTLLTCLITIYA